MEESCETARLPPLWWLPGTAGTLVRLPPLWWLPGTAGTLLVRLLDCLLCGGCLVTAGTAGRDERQPSRLHFLAQMCLMIVALRL